MIAATITLVLGALAGLHILWALGVWWPIRNEAGLARAVVGRPGIVRMPGAVPSALVAVALMWAAAWPWLGPDLGPGRNRTGLAMLVLVFALRGVAAWLPQWRRIWPEPAFARLDRRYYGPLCLVLAAGFAALLAGATP
jgi:hypothetical protein